MSQTCARTGQENVESRAPDGQLTGEALKAGEGEVIADLDFAQIDARKRLMNACGRARSLQPP